jgi:glycosyltransferase involved in cell wall biosynthesis
MSILPEPRTILYVHSSNDLYGADLILFQIANGLNRKKFRPIFILPDDMGDAHLLSDRLTEANIENHILPVAILRRRYFRPKHLLQFLHNCIVGTLKLWRLIRRNDVQLIHGTTLAVIAAPLVALVTNTPLLMHAHEILLRPKFVRKGIHVLSGSTARRILCVSDAVRNNILLDIPEATEKVVVIHNGIRAVTPPRRTKAELRRELGIPEDAIVVGMIGRISAWKGQEILVRAAALCRGRGSDAHFVAIGGTFDNALEPLENLEHEIASHRVEDRFQLIGFRDDARDFLYAFDVFVLPSTLPDPFPTVVLEAMSAKRAIIATSHGGVVEMLQPGESGVLVTPGDAEAMAKAILSLIEDAPLRERLGEAAAAIHHKKFDLDTYHHRVAELYEQLITPNGLSRKSCD